MDYVKEFLTRLQKGESLDSIAKEITTALNAAKVKAEEERQASLVREKKFRVVYDLYTSLAELLSCYDIPCPEPTNEEINKIIDSLDNEIPEVAKLLKKYAPDYKAELEVNKESIEDFLNRLGW